MRCSSCLSYIPEGLSEPITCPQCGKTASRPEPASLTKPAPPFEPEAEEPAAAKFKHEETGQPFAPYFTIRARLAFGPAAMSLKPSSGSLSFGESGFSIVWDEGRQWQKFLYRDTETPRLIGDSVVWSMREVESRLRLYPSSALGGVFTGGAKTRAKVLLDLFRRVQSGLTPSEISLFQRRLSSG